MQMLTTTGLVPLGFSTWHILKYACLLLFEVCQQICGIIFCFLLSYRDEELLGRGLELNDSIQSLLARHDAIASGTPFPIQGASSSTVSTEAQSGVDQSNINSSSPGESSSSPKASSPAIVFSETRSQSDEEEEDEFAQLARRSLRTDNIFNILWLMVIETCFSFQPCLLITCLKNKLV